MEWLGKLLELAKSALPIVIPEHIERQWLERLNDHNPFKIISANHDLVRATRLAWIEAALDILKEAHALGYRGEGRSSVAAIDAFDAAVTDKLRQARDLALDRRRDPGDSPIDAHLEAIINGVPETVSPGNHAGIGVSVTSGFNNVLAKLSGREPNDIPEIYGQLARSGITAYGGGPPRPFGELVFAAFAELIKDPVKYPQAREAFRMAMDNHTRETNLEILAAVQDVASKTASTEAKVDKVLRAISKNEGVPLEILRAILTEMGEVADALDAEQIRERLKAKAADFRSLTERLNRLSNEDPEVLRLRQAAAGELAEGRFLQADANLAMAEARDLSGVEEVEALAKQKRLSAAESRAERAAAETLRANPEAYEQAAIHYEEAARIAVSADAEIARDYLNLKGLALTDLGEEFGRNGALEEAIEHFQQMLRNVDRRKHPDAWGRTQNNLGNVLSMLGRREHGTARLEEAVAAYCAALEERTSKKEPLQWATTQNNLGNALFALGQRASDTQRLEDAVAAYRAALKKRTRKKAPLQWATTENNLGNALSVLGEREKGTARLMEAVAAHRASLKEWTSHRVPLQWAMAQNSLGNALSALGERESGTARLHEAVAAYNAALKEWTPKRVPLKWATAQNNLGDALSAIGWREGDTECLEEAVVAYRAALKEWTPERVPLDWANGYGGLGIVKRLIADRRNELALAKEALEHIQQAVDVFRKAGHVPNANYYENEASLARDLIKKLENPGEDTAVALLAE